MSHIDLQTTFVRNLKATREERSITQDALADSAGTLGLNGRPTFVDDPFVPGRNGAAALPMLLDTHAPLDLVVIMLGTNDVKRYFSVSPAQIARGIERLVSLVAVSDAGVNETAPPVLVVAPVPLAPMNGDMLPHFAPDEEAIRASRELAQSYKRMAAELGCSFFDGATAGAAVTHDP